MFGISLPKLLLLVAVIAAVWYGFKWFERERRVEKGGRRPVERSFGERLRKSFRVKEPGSAPAEPVEDTEKCPVCGVYVSVVASEPCGRADCPY